MIDREELCKAFEAIAQEALQTNQEMDKPQSDLHNIAYYFLRLRDIVRSGGE